MVATIVYGTPQSPKPVLTPYRSLVVHTPPAVEPVTLAEAKAQCRVDGDAEDAYLTALIATARVYCEEQLEVAIITQVLEARYDLFPLWEIVLPKPPMQPQTVSITYRNEAGAESTITSAQNAFRVDHYTTPGRIYPNYNGVWPAVRGDENSVVVRWTAGYGASGASVPPVLRQAMLLLVAHWFEMRQPVVTGYSQVLSVPNTFETLLAASAWGGYP